MPTRKFFIDTDTATDDAVALVMALRQPDIEVLGISTVAGNPPMTSYHQNALYTRDLVGTKTQSTSAPPGHCFVKNGNRPIMCTAWSWAI